LVTADGQLLTASATENPDLFWGLRGAGGNFGVVTSVTLRLQPVEPVVAGILQFEGKQLEELLRCYAGFAPGAPDSLMAMLLCLTAHSHLPIPARWHGSMMVALAICFCGSPVQAKAVLRPLLTEVPPVADLTAAMSYHALQRMFEHAPAGEFGLRHAQRSEYLARVTEADIAAMAQKARKMTSPLSAFEICHLGGAVARVGEDETAFSRRQAPFFTLMESTWSRPEEDEVHLRWVRELWSELRASSYGGTHPFFIDADEPPGRMREVHGSAKYERLAGLKRKYDPTNFFRFNKNIVP
jgi:hypothetical protein